MATQIKIINKYEFYNKYIQFLYPSLIITINNIEEKKQDDNTDEKCISSLYNSSQLNLYDKDNQQMDKMKELIMDLRDQGSEYFNKLLLIIQNNDGNNDKNVQGFIKQYCEQIAVVSKSINTFYIFNNNNNIFGNEYKILTTDWYNTFKLKYNINNCIGYPSLPSLIENNLFVGGRITVENLFILKSLNISVIINCTKDCPNYFESEVDMTYHRIEIDDKDNEDIVLHLQQCYVWLNEYISNKNLGVLIHCEQGKSRSVSMIVYYLIRKHKFDVEQSLGYVKNLRSIASPNKGFMDQLQRLYEQKK